MSDPTLVDEAMAYARRVGQERDVRQRLELHCPFCGALPGEWCYSWKSCRRSHHLHANRQTP